VSTPIARLRARLKALIAAAPRNDVEQSRLRVGIVGLVLLYLFWHVLKDGVIDAGEFRVLAVTGGFLAFGVVLGLCVLAAPNHAQTRRGRLLALIAHNARYIGMVGDNAVTTYFMSNMGEEGAVILFVYLFITFGNTIRFGTRLMRVCHVMGIVGFAVVLISSSFWRDHIWVWTGVMIAILVLPFYVGVLSDRLKAALKEADEASAAKGRFLANVSHEMRTPLNGVIAMADVLRETSLNESQREIVDTLGTSAHLLLAQIEDVLDMAKIEAGRVQIENAPFDLGGLISTTVKVVLPQARYRGLAVNTDVAPEAARWFLGDAHHLRQVLLNLLSNAIKFTERGEITLRVLAVNVNESDARVRFEVKDTGIGISPDKQALIFEPFAQADDSITRIYGGTGLGTTIARQLVTLMGGELGLVSELGVGSLFWVELPLAFGERGGLDLTSEMVASDRLTSASAAFAAQQSATVTKIRGARILVAEDNPTNQRVTQLILESGGHRATIVEDGEAALDALDRGSFDLALFDLSMPIVSGMEAVKLYRFTTQKPIPIIILSANVTTDIVADCQRAGCAEFIAKPVRPTVLLDAIERHLAESADANASFVAPPRAEDRPTLTVIDTPVVDKNVLHDLDRLSSDPTFVDRLVQGFHTDIERLIKSISDGLAARRYEDVKDAAHALKGGAGSVGASQLVQLALRFEKASHELLRSKAAAWMEELAHAASMALAALDHHVEERQRQSKN
jgi:two-component system, sensor histidine kinase RpfC